MECTGGGGEEGWGGEGHTAIRVGGRLPEDLPDPRKTSDVTTVCRYILTRFEQICSTPTES